jgi:hypothetical protein
VPQRANEAGRPDRHSYNARMTSARPIGVCVAALGISLLVGCGARVRLEVTQPGQPPPRDRLDLTGKWAFFDKGADCDRILLALAHPGAVDGARQYYLYLRVPPGKGKFTVGQPLSEEGDAGRCCGFYIQRTGELAGLGTLVAGELKIGGRPFDGGKIRTGRVNLECDDGTIIEGRFTARRGALELRDFEQDKYAADVAALIANPMPPPPAAKDAGF